MPSIHAVYEKVKDAGVAFVLVDLMESRETVKAAVAQRRYTLPILLDTTGEVAREYRVWGTPGVYLVNRRGYVVALGLGRRNWDSPEGIAVLRSLAD